MVDPLLAGCPVGRWAGKRRTPGAVAAVTGDDENRCGGAVGDGGRRAAEKQATEAVRGVRPHHDELRGLGGEGGDERAVDVDRVVDCPAGDRHVSAPGRGDVLHIGVGVGVGAVQPRIEARAPHRLGDRLGHGQGADDEAQGAGPAGGGGHDRLGVGSPVDAGHQPAGGRRVGRDHRADEEHGLLRCLQQGGGRRVAERGAAIAAMGGQAEEGMPAMVVARRPHGERPIGRGPSERHVEPGGEPDGRSHRPFGEERAVQRHQERRDRPACRRWGQSHTDRHRDLAFLPPRACRCPVGR